MNIGQAADASGVSAKRIRYYEQIGLIESAARTGAGYRVYDRRDLHTLAFIRRARQLGFSLPEIGRLLELWRDQRRSSADVRKIAKQHIDEMQAKIDELQIIVDTLEQLVSCCGGDERPDCPIIEDLERIES